MERLMGKDLAYFMENPDEFEGLSDEDRMLLSNGEAIEGEISGDSPAADETQVEDPQVEKGAEQDAPAPVVVAKDGVHTIPFEELQRARDEARLWQSRAEAAEAARQVQADPPADTVDIKALRRELREATLVEDESRIDELESQIDAELARRAESAAIRVVERRNAEQALASEQAEIERAASSMVAKYPALDHTKPDTANVEAIAMVQTLSAMYAQQGRGRSQALVDAVGRVATLFGFDAAIPDGNADAAAKADKVIAAASAKAKVPSSMAGIPAAPTPPADEIQALSQMSTQQIQDKMMDMPREKIMALLARQM
jgi:hypothetical protein